MDKVYLKCEDGKTRKKHAILTYKRKNRKVYVNRDRDAVKSMRQIVHEQLRTGQRPKNYCRGVRLPGFQELTVEVVNENTPNIFQETVKSKIKPIIKLKIKPIIELPKT
jgi:hypothetical protein